MFFEKNVNLVTSLFLKEWVINKVRFLTEGILASLIVALLLGVVSRQGKNEMVQSNFKPVA